MTNWNTFQRSPAQGSNWASSTAGGPSPYDVAQITLYNAALALRNSINRDMSNTTADATAVIVPFISALDTMSAQASAALFLRGMFGSPSGDGSPSPSTPVWAPNTMRVTNTQAVQALAQKEAVIDSAAEQADGMIADIVTTVLAGVAPPHPSAGLMDTSTIDAQIADRKADIIQVLSATGRNGATATAQALVEQAVSEKDIVTQYVVLGTPLKYVAVALGVKLQTVQRAYADARLASNDVPGVRKLFNNDAFIKHLDHSLSDAVTAMRAYAHYVLDQVRQQAGA